MENETFYVEARRCKRCGGLLTSKQAVKDGYGHVCKMKAAGEERERQPISGQLGLFDLFKDPEGRSHEEEAEQE